MKQERKIKRLRTQLRLAKGELEAVKDQIRSKQREQSEKEKVIAGLQAEIRKLSKQGRPRVSEHAILRYLERVEGVNVEEIEAKILSGKLLEWVDQLGGSGTYPQDGFQVVMKNNVVVTVK